MKKEEEFFIGWEGKAPEGIGKFLRVRTLALLGVAIVLGASLPALQSTITEAFLDWGNVQEFEGVLIEGAAPMLVLESPEEATGESVFLLSSPFKYGFDRAVASEHHLKKVRLKGTLIYDIDAAMIEVVEEGFEVIGEAGTNPLPSGVLLGERTLRGEIVDSKCYLGMMNPGAMKPHRACAIHCISGGVPPLLLLRGEDGETRKVLLAGAGGEPLNDYLVESGVIALPVEISGELTQRGELLILETKPEQITRIKP